uniref:Transcription factor bHLH84 n=1 Tax=Cajanus cajan TaxID=3821 RepID=A0A151U7P8_CAJCA|nr:Transcription factor bHLH84 [Cajanus cajan]
MEPVQLISEEWGSLCGLHTTEEADFMAQLFGGNYSVTEKHCGNTSFGFWPSHESTTVTMADTNSNSNFVSNVTDTNFLCFSQGSSSSTDSGELSLDPVALADNNLQAKREYEIMVSEPVQEDGSRNLETLTKRLRSSIEVSKTVRNAKSRKNPKSASMSNDEDDRSLSLPRHSCFSQGDSNASLEPNGGVSSKDLASPNSYRKSRATTRPATDSQSLYARKRRERINERLRILQNLVPNGTKVDISTMLEEAVQYVKFLQLQIKLLSSDDLWMYAPIAFNGINMGLDLSISPTKGR